MLSSSLSRSCVFTGQGPNSSLSTWYLHMLHDILHCLCCRNHCCRLFMSLVWSYAEQIPTFVNMLSAHMPTSCSKCLQVAVRVNCWPHAPAAKEMHVQIQRYLLLTATGCVHTAMSSQVMSNTKYCACIAYAQPSRMFVYSHGKTTYSAGITLNKSGIHGQCSAFTSIHLDWHT